MNIKCSLLEGDWISCYYPQHGNGELMFRDNCEVLEVPNGDSILVRTADGTRRFKYAKMAKVKLIRVS